jgi:hypothetical protein
MSTDYRGPRRHQWAADDETHATCRRCGAQARVVGIVTDAGLRASVQRHGPAKCPSQTWWGWGTKPLAPWEKRAKPAAPRAHRKANLEVGRPGQGPTEQPALEAGRTGQPEHQVEHRSAEEGGDS